MMMDEAKSATKTTERTSQNEILKLHASSRFHMECFPIIECEMPQFACSCHIVYIHKCKCLLIKGSTVECNKKSVTKHLPLNLKRARYLRYFQHAN
jgi:hypothetical protein